MWNKNLGRFIAICICLLATGICYSCNRQEEITDLLEPELQYEAKSAADGVESRDKSREEPTTEAVYYYVHICGEVVSPGVYQMEEGSRIFEVVEEAGGFTKQAVTTYLNLAELVEDGRKLVVPNVEETGVNQHYGEGEPAAKKVNLNKATKEELMTLRGIGEARALDILRYREEQGAFRTIEDIMKVSGIKEAAFQKIKDDITV